MSRLDEIKPSGKDGLYKVEVQVEGEWVLLCSMDKESIIKMTDYAEVLSDHDNETVSETVHSDVVSGVGSKDNPVGVLLLETVKQAPVLTQQLQNAVATYTEYASKPQMYTKAIAHDLFGPKKGE